MTLLFSLNDILAFESRYRATFINSLSGFKSVALIGTVGQNGNYNLAIFNSIFHLGAHPPMFGFIVRPNSVERHTLKNILSEKQFTVNHIHQDIYMQAHQTSARYDETISEFEATGLTPLIWTNHVAPFVKESNVKIAAELIRTVDIAENGTILIIAKINEVLIPKDCLLKDGFVDLELAGTITCSGLDSYHTTKKIARLNYAKPNQLTTKLINTKHNE